MDIEAEKIEMESCDKQTEAAEPPTLFTTEDLRERERAESLRGERRAILENGRKGKKHA